MTIELKGIDVIMFVLKDTTMSKPLYGMLNFRLTILLDVELCLFQGAMPLVRKVRTGHCQEQNLEIKRYVLKAGNPLFYTINHRSW